MRIPPQRSDAKPFRLTKTGKAYVRVGDADHEMSPQEQALMVGDRGRPRHELHLAEKATLADLEPSLLAQYVEAQLRNSRRLRALPYDEQLRKIGVVDQTTGTPTLAALYALGTHPQQFFPTLVVKVLVRNTTPTAGSVRLDDRPYAFTGPIPDLLASTQEWVAEHEKHPVVFGADGAGRDVPQFPHVSVRELVANALVHRDLSLASENAYVTVTLDGDYLTITNPGGLWGVTERELGRGGPSARNPILYQMCQAITTEDGQRVIEGSATGIPEVRVAQDRAQQPAPIFRDGVVAFTAALTYQPPIGPEEAAWIASLGIGDVLSIEQQHALVWLRNEHSLSVRDMTSRLRLGAESAARSLQELASYGLISLGADSRYRLARMSEQEKGRLVIAALQGGQPLTRGELETATGLTAGQLRPALQSLRRAGRIEFTEKQRSIHQRYRLVE